ncbi:hypothetical protein ACLIA0_03330 [Bacillaceae bacterium W0354]
MSNKDPLEKELNDFPKYELSEENEKRIYNQLMQTADELVKKDKRRMLMKRLTAGLVTVAAVVIVSFVTLTNLDLFNSAGKTSDIESQEDSVKEYNFSEIVSVDIAKLEATTKKDTSKEAIYRTTDEQMIHDFTHQMESATLIKSNASSANVDTTYKLYNESNEIITTIGFINNDIVDINGERYEINGTIEAFENIFFTHNYLLDDKTVIVEKANELVQLIANKDFEELSKHVHENKGLLFSPYVYIDEDALIFYPNEVRQLLNNQEVYVWGNYDGSGFPIELTGAEYYDEFIYNKNYMKADDVLYDEFVARGNFINNIKDVYPNSHVVEFYIAGAEYEMDWGSINLVFEQNIDGQWKLVAIVHDRWTI